MSSNCKLNVEPNNEDTLKCLFFSVTPSSDISFWAELCQQINNTIKTLSKDYIWHRDVFQVYIPIADSVNTGLPLHLQSVTCFGDNIEDEWYIVHLVMEISRQYKDIIIQVTDNDGEFLLIEAANNLQTWANPENTENRVFIYNNHIHIIPPEVISLETKVEINNALEIIHASPESTVASSDVEQAILRRIGTYPDKLLENTHRAVVKLPQNLAALLLLKPSLIAPIVNAYCNHDIIDAKACKNITFSDCVTIEVKFTKFLYATLMHSKPLTCIKKYIPDNDKKSILGAKLMCGFQMIMNKSSSDLFSSKDYLTFLNSLKQNGYFKNNIEGSKDYNYLLEKAKEYFTIVESPINSNLSHDISQLMLSSDYISMKDSIKDKPLVDHNYTGDNEDWLNINPEELNELLLTRYGKTSKLKKNDVISSEVVTTELSSFLKQTSDFEGIEADRNEKTEDNNIEFESDEFMACIEKMLKIISSDGADNGSSEDSNSDYDDMEYNEDNEDDDNCDRELIAKLNENQPENSQDSNNILANIILSMKEEKATGPTSNLLRSIGVRKSELLDSDDDVE